MTCEIIEKNETLINQLRRSRDLLKFDLLYAKDTILTKIEKDEKN